MALSQCIKRRRLAQKKIKFHAGVKKCHFGNFSECPVSAALKNPSVDMKNSFSSFSSYEFLAMLEGKIVECPFFRVQSDELTVCMVKSSSKNKNFFDKNNYVT